MILKVNKSLGFILFFILFSRFKNHEKDKAFFYSDQFDGIKTTSGETFTNCKLTEAHKTLHFGIKITVINSRNGKTV